MTHPAGAGQFSPRYSVRFRSSLIAGALVLLSPAVARAEDPAQWWNAFTGTVKTGIGTIESKAETRLFEGGDINLWNVEAVLMMEAGKRFAWGPGLKYQEQRAAASRFISEDRYLLVGRWAAGKTGPWRWTVRGVVEYREIEDRVGFWRYRLRPEVKRPLGSSKWEFGVSVEGYYDSVRDAYGQNRVQLGIQRPLNDHAALAIYYLLRSDLIAGAWQETQVFGTTWSFR